MPIFMDGERGVFTIFRFEDRQFFRLLTQQCSVFSFIYNRHCEVLPHRFLTIFDVRNRWMTKVDHADFYGWRTQHFYDFQIRSETILIALNRGNVLFFVYLHIYNRHGDILPHCFLTIFDVRNRWMTKVDHADFYGWRTQRFYDFQIQRQTIFTAFDLARFSFLFIYIFTIATAKYSRIAF